MKTTILSILAALAALPSVASQKTVSVDWSPYPFKLTEFVPDASRVFRITDYGAKRDGSDCASAIAKAVVACAAAGGGRVLVPAGTWMTGPLELKSGVELHLEKDAVLKFLPGSPDYPALPSPGGYAERRDGTRPVPFIRADNCEDVAITGEGTLQGDVSYWFRRENLGHSRPGFIWFDSCRRVLLCGVRVRQAAFWTIHMRLCTDVVLRALDVSCRRDIAPSYTNTDGVDIDSSACVLIEDCSFEQDDDVICMKSGKNEVGRKLGVPTEDVAVRRCRAKDGHGLLAIGSELSGGIRRVYMTDCEVTGRVFTFLRVKTNPKRGAYAYDITLENIRGKKARDQVIRLETNYPETGGVKAPFFYTDIHNITVRNVSCEEADVGVELTGDRAKPVRNFRIEGLKVGKTRRGFIGAIDHVEVIGLGEPAPKGWPDPNHDRRLMPPTKVLWKADLSQGQDGLIVERRKGAEGTATVMDGRITIAKTNGRGEIVIRAKPVKFPKGCDIRFSARAATFDATPLVSRACLSAEAPAGAKPPVCIDSENFGQHGPRSVGLVNTPPGTDEMRFRHFRIDGESELTPTITVGGPASTSVWREWQAEDYAAVKKSWNRIGKNLRNKDDRKGAIDVKKFEKQLKTERDHTAKVEKVNGVPRLVVDGVVHEPVIYKGRNVGFKPLGERMPFEGRRMECQADVRIMGTFVSGGRTHNYPWGFWMRDGFDAKGATASIRTAMRIAPKSNFILALALVPYPDFGKDHPDEVWRAEDGKIVYGNESVIYGTTNDLNSLPTNRWAWVSYASPSFRAAVKRNIDVLVAELKLTGLAKRVVGLHLCGFRDWQFSAAQIPDHSEVMKRAWRERGGGRSFDSFRQAEGCAFQNEIARYAKEAFGKDIVVIRWCLNAFSGECDGSYDIGEFCRSDALDMLCAQPMYISRGPAVPLGIRLPLSSFAAHNKIFINEFDWRTDCALEPGSSEASEVALGCAKGMDMWRSLYRRAAGQMIAHGEGWWFYDMTGSWFASDDIAYDISSSIKAYRDVMKADVGRWRPTAAVLIDEQDALRGVFERRKNRGFNPYHALFAASGVPYEQWLSDDWVERPELSDGIKAVVWFGLGEKPNAPRQLLLDRFAQRGVRVIRPKELATATPADLHRIARKAGAYVPCDRPGLQVDMNGAFVSMHCLVPGRYDFKLPFAAKLVNDKTGLVESTDGTLALDLMAGETRWYLIR